MDKQLRHIQVGDRVAVVRKESGVLHFFVNSEDQVEHIFYKDKDKDKDNDKEEWQRHFNKEKDKDN